jgi:hypothetical protein
LINSFLRFKASKAYTRLINELQQVDGGDDQHSATQQRHSIDESLGHHTSNAAVSPMNHPLPPPAMTPTPLLHPRATTSTDDVKSPQPALSSRTSSTFPLNNNATGAAAGAMAIPVLRPSSAMTPATQGSSSPHAISNTTGGNGHSHSQHHRPTSSSTVHPHPLPAAASVWSLHPHQVA